MEVHYEVEVNDHVSIALDFLQKNSMTSKMDIKNVKFIDCDYQHSSGGVNLGFQSYKFKIQFIALDSTHEVILITSHRTNYTHKIIYAMLDGEHDLTKG